MVGRGHAASILANGGFEASGGDEFVADWSRVENNEGTIDLDTEQVHGGDSSVRFTMSNSWEYWITGDLLDPSLQAGDRVQVTGYFRADRTDTTPQLGIWLTNEDMRYLDLPTSTCRRALLTSSPSGSLVPNSARACRP